MIAGETTAQLRHNADISPQAKLASPPVITITHHDADTSYSSPRYYWHAILLWGASFVFGLVMLLLMPGFFFDAAGACKRIGPAIGFGALFLIALPILAVIVCITIVGIGVGLTALMFWVIAIYAAQVVVGAWLGGTVAGVHGRDGSSTWQDGAGATDFACRWIDTVSRSVGRLAGPMFGFGRDCVGDLPEYAATAGNGG